MDHGVLITRATGVATNTAKISFWRIRVPNTSTTARGQRLLWYSGVHRTSVGTLIRRWWCHTVTYYNTHSYSGLTKVSRVTDASVLVYMTSTRQPHSSRDEPSRWLQDTMQRMQQPEDSGLKTVIQGLQPHYTFKSCRWKTPRELLRSLRSQRPYN